jgi:hypothetical protein
VLLGDGDGTFEVEQPQWAGDHLRTAAIVDLDADTLPDIVTADDRFVVVLFNRGESSVGADIAIRAGGPRQRARPGRHDVIRVTLFGSDGLPVHEVDRATLRFAGASPVHQQAGEPLDENGDGFADLVSFYRLDETGIAPGQESACLSGSLFDTTTFAGCDAIASACRRARGRPDDAGNARVPRHLERAPLSTSPGACRPGPGPAAASGDRGSQRR